MAKKYSYNLYWPNIINNKINGQIVQIKETDNEIKGQIIKKGQITHIMLEMAK